MPHPTIFASLLVLAGCTGAKSGLCALPDRACVASCTSAPTYFDACAVSRCPDGMIDRRACLDDAGPGRTDAGECVETPCFDPVECVRMCGGAIVYTGCCDCPAGTFDQVSCFDGGCADLRDPTTCTSVGCAWEPAGCGTAPDGHLAGFCYAPPLVGCGSSGCAPGLECTPAWIDPCRDSKCTACGAEAFFCMPP